MTTVKELRNNIKGYSKMRKADLLRVLNIASPPTVKDLRKIAKDKNIKGYYKMKKTDLIDAIRRHDEIINKAFPFEDSLFQPELENPSNNNNHRNSRI